MHGWCAIDGVCSKQRLEDKSKNDLCAGKKTGAALDHRQRHRTETTAAAAEAAARARVGVGRVCMVSATRSSESLWSVSRGREVVQQRW